MEINAVLLINVVGIFSLKKLSPSFTKAQTKKMIQLFKKNNHYFLPFLRKSFVI